MKTLFKSCFIGVFLLGWVFTCGAQHNFQIKARLKDTSANGNKVTLTYFDGTRNATLTTVVKDGSFKFKGSTTEPGKATVSMTITPKSSGSFFTQKDSKELFIDEGTITIEGLPLATAVVSSTGRSQNEYQSYMDALRPFVRKESESRKALVNASKENDSEKQAYYEGMNARDKLSIDSVTKAFIKTNSTSYVSLYLVKDQVNINSLANNADGLAEMYGLLSDEIKQTAIGRQLGARISIASDLAPGKPAKDFTLNDTVGNPVQFSSFRGKYVLLDFWASWCLPCRLENRKVVEAYNRFKDKNFTVLGVSLEKPGDEKAWMDAIHADKLTWTHVSSLSAFDDVAARLYGVTGIPMNFLIDPDGIIIASNIRGQELMNKLIEILD